jgi:hypothetical protein
VALRIRTLLLIAFFASPYGLAGRTSADSSFGMPPNVGC